MKNILVLIFAIALPVVLGGVAGAITSQAIPEWYSTLNKPSFNPPSWLFGPVWTALYILMGYSSYLIWQSPVSQKRTLALRIYAIHLVFNIAWSFIFFYFQSIGLALIEIIVLWGMILWMIIVFRKVNPFAANLNITYLLWVSFATVLNAAIWWLN